MADEVCEAVFVSANDAHAAVDGDTKYACRSPTLVYSAPSNIDARPALHAASLPSRGGNDAGHIPSIQYLLDAGRRPVLAVAELRRLFARKS